MEKLNWDNKSDLEEKTRLFLNKPNAEIIFCERESEWNPYTFRTTYYSIKEIDGIPANDHRNIGHFAEYGCPAEKMGVPWNTLLKVFHGEKLPLNPHSQNHDTEFAEKLISLDIDYFVVEWATGYKKYKAKFLAKKLAEKQLSERLDKKIKLLESRM